jgi:hypothetical protein
MWSHKKQFKGSFKIVGKKVISFESWQQAKKQGWSKMS